MQSHVRHLSFPWQGPSKMFSEESSQSPGGLHLHCEGRNGEHAHIFPFPPPLPLTPPPRVSTLCMATHLSTGIYQWTAWNLHYKGNKTYERITSQKLIRTIVWRAILVLCDNGQEHHEKKNILKAFQGLRRKQEGILEKNDAVQLFVLATQQLDFIHICTENLESSQSKTWLLGEEYAWVKLSQPGMSFTGFSRGTAGGEVWRNRVSVAWESYTETRQRTCFPTPWERLRTNRHQTAGAQGSKLANTAETQHVQGSSMVWLKPSWIRTSGIVINHPDLLSLHGSCNFSSTWGLTAVPQCCEC